MYGLPPEEASGQLETLPRARGPLGGFAEGFRTNYDVSTYTGSEWSDYALMGDALKERADRIEKLTGKRFGNTMPYLGYDAVRAGKQTAPKGGTFSQNEWDALWQEADKQERDVEALRATHPDIPTRRELEEKVKERAAQIEREASYINSNLSLLGHVGQFSGALAGSFAYNPKQTALNVVTAPLIGVGGSAVKVAANMLKNGLVSMGVTAAGEFGGTGVQATRDALGLSSGTDEALRTIGMAGLTGVATQGAFEGLGRVAPVVGRTLAPLSETAADRLKPLLGAFRRDVETPLPVEQLATDIVDRALEEARLPVPLDKAGEKEVAAALATQSPLPDLPLPTLSPKDSRVVRPDLIEVSARDLMVDAQRFQFKGGGDADGVTNRLKGVTAWNPDLGGTLIAWQDKTGKLFVADGHQRVGLANRLLDAKAHDDIRLPIRILKEEDGFTPERAMVYAAGKNIAEGTGDVVDAARVMRTAPQWLPELPRNSQLVRTARDLSSVSDDVFRLTLNDRLRPEYAAMIGRLEKNPDHHLALAAVLMRTEPETLFQAESILRQARAAGFTEGTQETLFGNEFFATSLFKERAKVLERALRLLKDDTKTFKVLTQRAETIMDAGNDLNKAGNASRLTGAEAVLSLITRLANTKGEISDALNTAARAYSQSGKLGKEAGNFVAAVRSSYDDGRLFSGISDGPDGAVPQPAAQGLQGHHGQTLDQIADDARHQAETAETLPVFQGEDLPPGSERGADTGLPPTDEGKGHTLLQEYGLPNGLEATEDGTLGARVTRPENLAEDLADDDALMRAMQECLL